ncbi:MAG TPA: protein kinase, partial [Polyangiales bacterium]
MSVTLHKRASSAGPERVAGRYELTERLAQGGMGEVFVARELATGRQVALKRLLPAARKRHALFRAEYQVLARLKHPHIIEVHEFGV